MGMERSREGQGEGEKDKRREGEGEGGGRGRERREPTRRERNKGERRGDWELLLKEPRFHTESLPGVLPLLHVGVRAHSTHMDTCVHTAKHNALTPTPLGSTFRIYTAGEVGLPR